MKNAKKVYFVNTNNPEITYRMINRYHIEIDDEINPKFRRIWCYNKQWCGFESFKDAKSWLIDWSKRQLQNSKIHFAQSKSIKKSRLK